MEVLIKMSFRMPLDLKLNLFVNLNKLMNLE